MAEQRGQRTTQRRLRAGVLACGLATMTVVSSCARGGRSVEAFCDQVRQVQDIDEVLASGSPEKTNQSLAALRELAAVAPEDIAPQVERLVGTTDELAHAMGTALNPDVAAAQVFARHQADLPAITQAGQAVERYATEHCQVTLNPTGTAPTSTTPTTVPSTTTTATTKATTTTTRAPASPTSARSGASTTSRPSSTTTTTATVRGATTRSTARAASTTKR